jgi:hypothetical protein
LLRLNRWTDASVSEAGIKTLWNCGILRLRLRPKL